MKQTTIAKSVEITGIGIHSGSKVTMRLYPDFANTGISFKRVDIKDASVLKADVMNVGATQNNTTLGSGSNCVHTVEHFLAALYGFGIDNLYVEIDGPEVPIMDGSCASFSFVLREAGLEYLEKPKKILKVQKKVRVVDGDSWATIEPWKNLCIDSTIVFAHPCIKKQRKIYDFESASFFHAISRARTFGLLKDVDKLKEMGLIKGGSLDNAIVLDDFKVLNEDGLRYNDEFVRHKILDTIGDISLLGALLLGKITTYKSGHKLHNHLCRELISDHSNFSYIKASPQTQEQDSIDLSESLSLQF